MSTNNRKSIYAGLFVGGLVCLERFTNEKDFETILAASAVQSVQTYIVARVCIVLYGKGVDMSSEFFSRRVGKIITGGSIGVSSGALNYYLQSDTGGSLAESAVMTGLSSLGIMAHEYGLSEKLALIFKNIKLQLGK